MDVVLNIPWLPQNAAHSSRHVECQYAEDDKPRIEVDDCRQPLWMLERASRLPENLAAAVLRG